MRVGITGGFGFVGRHLVNRLLQEPYELLLLSNQNRQLEPGWDSVSMQKGQVEDIESLKKAFKGCDAIIHLVGLIAETKSKTFVSTVAEGTTNVVNAAVGSGVKKIVYLSALGTRQNAVSNYHKTKYLAEQAVRESGLTYTILRPSVIYGPGDGFISLLTKMIKSAPVTPVIGDGKYKLQPVFIDDVCNAMALSLTTPAAENRIINLAGEEELEYLDILHILKEVMGKKRMNFHLPLPVMKIAAGLLEKILKPAPLTRDQLIMMAEGNCGDNSDMKEIFKIQPMKFKSGLLTYMRNN